MSWDDLVSEVGPWLPEDRQELPLKLFDGYKVSDIDTWTIRSGSLYRCNELVPNRKVNGEIDGVSVNGTKPIGPALIVAKPDGDQMWSQEQYAQYFANAKKSYVDGDPKPEQEFMKIMDPAFTPKEGMEEMTKKAEMPKKRRITVFVHDVDDPDEFDDFGDLALDSVLIRITPGNELSEAGRRILAEVIPEVVELFLNKSADYKNAHESLGPKAQYVDLHRKMGKLKSALWEGQELQYEQVDEILMDLAGHVFLALDGINKENNK